MGILKKTEELIPVTCAILSADERETFFEELRKRASGNMQRIAKTVGTTTAVVQDWAHGRVNVPYHALQVMANEFNVPLPPVTELRREMQLVVEPAKPRYTTPPPPPPEPKPERERKPARSRGSRGQERRQDRSRREQDRREQSPVEREARPETPPQPPQEALTEEEREMREHMRQEAERQERSRLAREHALHGPIQDYGRRSEYRQRQHGPRQERYGQRQHEQRPHEQRQHDGRRQEQPRQDQSRRRRGRKERGPRPEQHERPQQAPRPQQRPQTSKDPKLSDRLAYWTGVLLARGACREGAVVLEADRLIGQNFADTWASLTADIFGVRPELSMSEDRKTQKASFPASELEVFLGRLSFKEGSQPSSASAAPRWAWSNPDWKAAFLKGVVDACARFHRDPRLQLGGLSEDLRRSTVKMLGSLGFSTKTDGDVSLEGREAVASYFEKVGTQNIKLRDQITAYLKGEEPASDEDSGGPEPEARAAAAELPAPDPEQALDTDKAQPEGRLPDPEQTLDTDKARAEARLPDPETATDQPA